MKDGPLSIAALAAVAAVTAVAVGVPVTADWWLTRDDAADHIDRLLQFGAYRMRLLCPAQRGVEDETEVFVAVALR